VLVTWHAKSRTADVVVDKIESVENWQKEIICVPGRIDGRKRPVSDSYSVSHATGKRQRVTELTVDKDVFGG